MRQSSNHARQLEIRPFGAIRIYQLIVPVIRQAAGNSCPDDDRTKLQDIVVASGQPQVAALESVTH